MSSIVETTKQSFTPRPASVIRGQLAELHQLKTEAIRIGSDDFASRTALLSIIHHENELLLELAVSEAQKPARRWPVDEWLRILASAVSGSYRTVLALNFLLILTLLALVLLNWVINPHGWILSTAVIIANIVSLLTISLIRNR